MTDDRSLEARQDVADVRVWIAKHAGFCRVCRTKILRGVDEVTQVTIQGRREIVHDSCAADADQIGAAA